MGAVAKEGFKEGSYSTYIKDPKYCAAVEETGHTELFDITKAAAKSAIQKASG